jgi:3',5'-cyclic AMP phosphodiesterase CpdA
MAAMLGIGPACQPLPHRQRERNATMIGTVTLAHISDLHLTPVEGFGPRHWNMKRGLGFLNWHRGRKAVHRRDVLDRLIVDMLAQAPDHIAVTGDLVNIGLPAEYEVALRWLESLGPPDMVTVVPGNHDIYVKHRKTMGVRRWAPYMAPDAWGAGRVKARNDGFPFLRRLGPAALVCLNSAVPTPVFEAGGRLGREQLHALGLALDELAREGLMRVVLIHHPPFPGQAPPRRALEDAMALESVFARHGAELVLHGHNHRDTMAWRRCAHGDLLVVGIASGSAGRQHNGDPLARYNLFRLTRDESGFTIEFQARGLLTPHGNVADLERKVLRPEVAESARQV